MFAGRLGAVMDLRLATAVCPADMAPHTAWPEDAAPEVLVIGGGIAALCAAIAARRAGARVVLVECAPQAMRGGNARHARNLRIAHAEPTALSPGRYPADEFYAELQRASGGTGHPTLCRVLANGSADIVPWLRRQGVLFQPAGDGLLPVSRRTCFLHGGGKAAINALYATATRLGVAICYEAMVTALEMDAATLRAVAVRTATGLRTLRPATVVFCCAGEQANPAALRPYWGEAAANFIVRGTPYADGGVLRDLLAQGVAAVGEPGACHLVAVDARSPKADGGIVTRVLGIPAGIVVDRSACRFHDEGGDSGPARYAVWGRKVAQRPGQIAWLILDAVAGATIPPLLFPPFRGETPTALGEAAGLDPVALAATLAGFNAAVTGTGGTRGLLPEKTRHARRLEVPPFAAVPIRPGITFTCHGVRVDEAARVVMATGARSTNMFAAGMIMAPGLLGTGYLAGAGLTMGSVYGRIAGEAAARYARTVA